FGSNRQRPDRLEQRPPVAFSDFTADRGEVFGAGAAARRKRRGKARFVVVVGHRRRRPADADRNDLGQPHRPMSPTTAPEQFLRRQRRRAREIPLAWGLSAGLAGICWVDAVRLNWVPESPRWALLAGGGSLILLGMGAYRWWRLRLVDVARGC